MVHREPPLLGTEPAARVWTLANETADPATHPVLDIGGETGRNTLALARRGHPVDVVEMTPKFADTIRADADRESLNVRVTQRDIFTTDDDLRRDYRMIVLSEVVSDFRTSQQLRALFELATPRSRATQQLSRQTRRPLRHPDCPCSSFPTTRCTSTRSRTCPKEPGRRQAGTPTGSAASTCSICGVRTVPSKCAGSCTRSRLGSLR
jgi:protein-L-isoaspartate O-methyltransferase